MCNEIIYQHVVFKNILISINQSYYSKQCLYIVSYFAISLTGSKKQMEYKSKYYHEFKRDGNQ